MELDIKMLFVSKMVYFNFFNPSRIGIKCYIVTLPERLKFSAAG